MTLKDIYLGGLQVINHFIRREHTAQGHYLTGNLEQSLTGKVVGDTLIGEAADYALVINEGLEPNQISWKMLPGLIKYFVLRGYPVEDSKRIAMATIRKQMQEGMSTQASKRFSKTGGRQHFIEAAFTYPEIDEYFSTTFDFTIDEVYQETKSETI